MARNPKWKRDELILALNLYFKVNPIHTSENNPDIIALSKLLNSLPIHAIDEQQKDFRNPNGVYMKLCNFLRFDPSYHGKGLTAGSKLEEDIWNEFSDDKAQLERVALAIRTNSVSLPPCPPDEEEDEEFTEGRVLTRTHRLRERNPIITKKKKTQVLDQTGKLECTVCGFNFATVYGHIGNGFAECHHNKPVSELVPGEKTKLSDLSIICANCHRMIHRAKPWLSPGELRSRIELEKANQSLQQTANRRR